MAEEDLWEPTPNNRASVISRQVEIEWNNQLEKLKQPSGKSETENVSFGWALIRANKKWILQQIVLQLILLSLRFSIPIVLGSWLTDKP